MTLRVLLPLFSPGACFASAPGAARVLSVLVFGALGVAWVVEFVTLGACARAVLAGHPVPGPRLRAPCGWRPRGLRVVLQLPICGFGTVVQPSCLLFPAFHLRRLGAISGPRRGNSTALQAGELAKKFYF